MGYEVDRFDINMETDSARLEVFLIGLGGEIVSIVPNVKKTTLAQFFAQIYGRHATSICSSSSNGQSWSAGTDRAAITRCTRSAVRRGAARQTPSTRAGLTNSWNG